MTAVDQMSARDEGSQWGPIRPIQVLGAVPVDGHVVIRTATRTLSINNHIDAVWAVLRYANGHLSTDDILKVANEETGLELAVMAAVVDDLLRLGVLVDSRSMHRQVMSWSDNPMVYSSDMRINEWTKHERKSGWTPAGDSFPLPKVSDPSPWVERFSCRSFDSEPVSTAQLARLLQHASERPPSGGGLYPVRLAVILRRTDGVVPPGLYHYDVSKHALVQARAVCEEELLFFLNRADGVHDAPATIVISADFNRQSKKYANRGWRYSLVEAGVAVERVLHLALEAGLASLVFGGYDDIELSRALYAADADDVRTITTVALGRAARTTPADMDLEGLNTLLDDLFVGEGRIVESTGATNLWRLPGDLSFHQVLTTLRAPQGATGSHADVRNRMCGGTGPSIVQARAKALVEAVERHASRIVRVDTLGTPDEVPNAIDVPKFLRLRPEQVDAHDYLTHFSKTTPIQWSTGHVVSTGEPVSVPVDLVNYPISSTALGRKPFVAANSSGIASHTRDEDAIHRGFLELLERHVVLTSWHRQEAPARLNAAAYTPYLASRAHYWASQGYEMSVLDYSLGGLPVVGVVIGSQALIPGFTFGSAADLSWTAAAHKAMHEAEVGLAGYRAHPESPLPSDLVHTPLDHGRWHAYDESRTALKFLASRPASAGALQDATHDALEQSLRTFGAIAVRIDSPAPIKTFRVLSAAVFPISFGYSLEHRPEWSVAPDLPHFIA